MRVLMVVPIPPRGSKFSGNGQQPPNYEECPIPHPQPQAFWWRTLVDLGHDVLVVPFYASEWPGFPLPKNLARLAVRLCPPLERAAPATSMYFQNTLPVRAFNAHLIRLADSYKPDFFFVSGGVTALAPASVRRMRDSGTKCVIFRGASLCTHRCKNEMLAAEYFDLAVVNDPHQSIDWTVCGCPRTVALPISACEPTFHRPTETEKTENISFIGSFEPRLEYGDARFLFLEEIADLGLHIYSPSENILSSHPRLLACWRGPCKQSQIPEVISRAKINVNILARSMPGGGNYRTFEIPACGGFQMCDRFDDSWFEPDREIVKFSSPSELRRLCLNYLEDDDQRSKIACAGQQKALASHTIRNRFERLFELLGKAD